MSNYATYADDIEANEGPITGATDVMATAGTAFTPHEVSK